MVLATKNTVPLSTRLINGLLGIKPLYGIAKHQARQMMVKRGERIGVPWKKQVEEMKAIDWESEIKKIENSRVSYPDYYMTSFHAYQEGNLGWKPALELEVAALTVHSTLFSKAGEIEGDSKLRASFHDLIKSQIPEPQDILDMACGVGLSTFALQETYPQAKVTGLDLSPYFLSVANYRSQQRQADINWVHGAAESTGLPDSSFDLISIFLACHELPQSATRQIFTEARRLLRPNGHLAVMDMNPQSEIYQKMPPYVFTLLKSTEPYLDEYFTLNIEEALVNAGFQTPTITPNSPRHRTVVAQVIK
ncbi:class I SAM-dependent methyltransferase [Rivularia sp. UHCC 0363]|uniref:class I SAM-dependent methyltransferase n=1 Tax=Rivularia sp. UHCC 0363 TaxID=3110244 RepID=UPI002B1FC613|nr:class I SAM-dependent methyltransferase [Rivularia sp. UHCC 0363]MEA5593808.1 class I SAM-dependent methyltransferase [Rivularia sp. UHCC 0363]